MSYVVFDDANGVLKASEDQAEAQDAASFYAKKDGEPGIGVDAEAYQENPVYDNPAPPLEQAGLRPLSFEEVMGWAPNPGPETALAYGARARAAERESLLRAYGVLKRYFPVQSGLGYAPYQPDKLQPLSIVVSRGFLKQNAKLAKTEVNEALGEVPSVAYGLSLIPAAFAAKVVDSNGDDLLPELKGKARGWGPGNELARSLKPQRNFNLCPNATVECMRSCLVRTGKNDEVRNYSKLLMTYALQNHPVEFVRLLVAAIDKYVRRPAPEIQGKRKFVRLNVYSDIVWEQFVPWLFDRYAGEEFGGYDYSKVSGRIGNTPPNYDITFSYSGTNIDECHRLLSSGHGRVAVVFVKGKKEWPGLFIHGPTSFRGYHVVNGDRHDFRPFDPLGVWVALRWKSPRGFIVRPEEAKAFGQTLKKTKPVDVIKKFVIRAELVDGQWISVQPNKTPAVSLV